MNAISLNNLWTFLQDLKLTDNNKKWLADHLYESVEAKKTAAQSKAGKILQITPEDLILSADILEPVKDITPLPVEFDLEKARKDYLMQKYG
ncbi:MAG: hypothetical protein K6G92_10875 [Bacteroidaceae bacterium]|nr:hypothetical protein [Bacteroidaceae bacterium]